MTTAARPSLPPPRRPPRSGRRSCVLCYGRALLSGALFVACSRDTRLGPAVEARDSAGVRVVEAHRPVWGDSSRWRIDPEPLVDLAATGSGPEHLFYRADGVVRFSDGSLAVADGGSHEIRFFSPEGRFRAKMGREGEGPGEFTGIRGVVRTPADTLLVLDYAARVTVVGPDGTVARVFRLPHYVVEVHPLGADEIVVVAGVPTMSGYEGAGGLVRQPQVLWRYGADGARRDSIGEIAGWEEYVAVEDGRVVASIVPLFAKSSRQHDRAGRCRQDADRGDVFVRRIAANLPYRRLPARLGCRDRGGGAQGSAGSQSTPEDGAAAKSRQAPGVQPSAGGRRGRDLVASVPGPQRTRRPRDVAGAGLRRDLAGRRGRDGGPAGLRRGKGLGRGRLDGFAGRGTSSDAPAEANALTGSRNGQPSASGAGVTWSMAAASSS